MDAGQRSELRAAGRRPARPRSPDPRRVVERLAARDTEVAGAARAFLGLPDPTPEQVHRLHAELRRLRVEHRLFRSLLRPDGTDRARALDRRLAEVARRVGTVRDADVELHLLEPTPRGTRSAAASPGDLVRRLRDDARIGRELLRAYLQAELRAGLFEGLGATLAQPLDRKAAARFPEAEVERARRRLLRAFKRARRQLSERRAHLLRVQLRRTRYLMEFLGTVPGAGRGEYPKRLARLQHQLGRLHDLDVLHGWIEGLAPALQRSEWARRTDAVREATRQRVRRELDRTALKEGLRSLGT